MQKICSYSFFIIILSSLLICLHSCKSDKKGVVPPTSPDKSIKSLKTEISDSVKVKNKAADVLRMIKAADWKTLSEHIHPEEGLRISPYADIDLNCTVLEFEDLLSVDTTKLYNWGAYDGSGSPIRMNLAEYHRKFMYEVDFINAEKIIYNKFAQYGNTRNTIPKMYPECQTIEYYLSGKGSEFEGFNWRALRLVFKSFNDEWYLVALVHSQWTM